MPDFEFNEGYLEAGGRRADSPLSADAQDGPDAPISSEPIVAQEGDARADEWGATGHKLPERTPIVRRTRHLATGHIAAGRSGSERAHLAVSGRRVGVKLISRRRRLARRACPYGWKVWVLGTPPRSRRRLWTTCHGQSRPPGSPS